MAFISRDDVHKERVARLSSGGREIVLEQDNDGVQNMIYNNTTRCKMNLYKGKYCNSGDVHACKDTSFY